MINKCMGGQTIAPAGMHILCIAVRYNKPNNSENHKSILFITLLLYKDEMLSVGTFWHARSSAVSPCIDARFAQNEAPPDLLEMKHPSSENMQCFLKCF